MQTEKDIFHIISNTHWDREWRFPFQRNRQMLVDMIDAVLDILESEPEYRAFHLDSQSIVLKDYLEIKPQNKERIIKLTRENRLLHGPWYILPEEFQVGGENHIRNLLLGHKTSHAHGGVSKIGYSPFSWGQISNYHRSTGSSIST
jgi:mannosylglycerate hydrolase